MGVDMVDKRRNVVLLDLDGTLTQSDPGILACVRKAYEELNLPLPSKRELYSFIGPSIIESLRNHHVPAEKLDQAVTIYRDYYANRAVFDDPNNPGQLVPGRLFNRLYPGIVEQLKLLRSRGYVLAIATCKPEYQAIPICQHFHLDTLVDGIYGASEDTSRLHKDQVIRYVFENIGFRLNTDRALMVGDRWTDVDGAIACGLDCLGCGWGYAEPGELESHGAYRVIDTVEELTGAVDDYFAKD